MQPPGIYCRFPLGRAGLKDKPLPLGTARGQSEHSFQIPEAWLPELSYG